MAADPQVALQQVTLPAVPATQLVLEKATGAQDIDSRSSLLDFNALKTVVTYVGIAGTGGGGFAALSFGIGYLAIKSHDEMMGMPGSIASNTAYVQTGALFFTNSLYYMFSAILPHLIVTVSSASVILAIIALARRFSRTRSVLATPGGLDHRRRIGFLLFSFIQFALLLAAFLLTYYEVAALDPMNKNLLYKFVVKRDKAVTLTVSTVAPNKDPASSAHVVPADSSLFRRLNESLGEGVKLLSQAITLREASGLAMRINEDLQKSDGPALLRRRYGFQVGVFLLLCVAVALTHRWRHRLYHETTLITQANGPAPPPPLFLLDWFVRAPLYGLVAAFLFNLPANYGVLCLPSGAAFVQIQTSELPKTMKSIKKGYLLSDLSNETKEIWILGEDTNKNFALAVFKREQVLSINVIELRPNILALE